MHVQFYEVFEEERAELQALLPSGITAAYESATFQSAGSPKGDADIWCIRTQSELYDAPDSLKGVLARCTGSDHLSRLQISEHVHRGHLSEYCSNAVAEHAVTCAMMLLRRIPEQTRHFETFNRDHLTGREIRGAKVLVCGVGRIGYQICRICDSLGMEVTGFDSDPRHPDIVYMGLNEGVLNSDVVICALPLTELTAGMLSSSVFSKDNHSRVLVNISRGEITPAADLLRLMDSGNLYGVALDAYENEPVLGDALRTGSEMKTDEHRSLMLLKKYANVVMTPHNAFNTKQSTHQKAVQTVEALQYFLEHARFPLEV